MRRGGYVLREASGGAGSVQVILIGTGSELQLAFGAAEALEKEGVPSRVVSLPCWELFERQDGAYRESVLPARVSGRGSRVEAGVSLGWERWVGDDGRDRRARPLRRVGAGRDDLREVRLHDRSRRGGRPRRARRQGPTARSRRSSRATCPRRAAVTRHSPAATPASIGPSGTDPGHS